MQKPFRTLRGHPHASRGGVMAWIVVAVAAMITAVLVVVFLRHLPAPPRFDDLRIEPGSTRTVTRGIIRRLWVADGPDPVVASVDDVRLDGWPLDPDGRPAVRVVYRVPIERTETTFVRFLIDGEGIRATLRRGPVEVFSAGDRGPFTAESASVVVPDGASDLDIEVIPEGPPALDEPTARLRIRWQEVDGPAGGPWPLGGLVQSTDD